MKLIYCNKCFTSFPVTRSVMQTDKGHRVICDCFDIDQVLSHDCSQPSMFTPAKPLETQPENEPAKSAGSNTKAFPNSNPLSKPPTPTPESIKSIIDSMKGA